MIHMPNRPNIHMRLRTLERRFRHGVSSFPSRRAVECGARHGDRRLTIREGVLRRIASFYGAWELELVDGLEPSTSPLPRECSTAELHEPTWTRERVLSRSAQERLERETGFEPATFSLGS